MASKFRYVKIDGELHGIRCPNVHEQVCLFGSGEVFGMAIRRTSRNVFKTWSILSFGAFEGTYYSFKQAAEHIQDVYTEFGGN